MTSSRDSDKRLDNTNSVVNEVTKELAMQYKGRSAPIDVIMQKIEERLAATRSDVDSYSKSTPKGPLPKLSDNTRKIKGSGGSHFDYLYGRKPQRKKIRKFSKCLSPMDNLYNKKSAGIPPSVPVGINQQSSDMYFK